MEEVVRRGLADQAGTRKVRPVPVEAEFVLEVEEVKLISRDRTGPGVISQGSKERGGATALSTDDHEVGIAAGRHD